VSRSFFTFQKFAFPCDDEVPFAISCCCVTFADKLPGEEQVRCCPKPPSTEEHMVPMFPAIPKKAAAPDSEDMARK